MGKTKIEALKTVPGIYIYSKHPCHVKYKWDSENVPITKSEVWHFQLSCYGRVQKL